MKIAFAVETLTGRSSVCSVRLSYGNLFTLSRIDWICNNDFVRPKIRRASCRVSGQSVLLLMELIEEARFGGEFCAGASEPADQRDDFPVQWVLGT